MVWSGEYTIQQGYQSHSGVLECDIDASRRIYTDLTSPRLIHSTTNHSWRKDILYRTDDSLMVLGHAICQM